MLKIVLFTLFAFVLVACGDRPVQLVCPNLDFRLDTGSDTKPVRHDMEVDAYCNYEAAGCPALHLGDIFIVRCKPMKYIINGQGKALYFPFTDGASDILYNTWRTNDDGILTIRQSCLGEVSFPSTYPGGVNFRPGSFVIKRPTSDQLYVVEPGNTIAKISSHVAATLYTPAYPGGINDDPVVVPDVFWPHLVNRGPDIVDVRVHPGMLFVVGADQSVFFQSVYYADPDGSIRQVTVYGFAANHFQFRFMRRVSSLAVSGMPISKTIDALVPEIDDPTQGG